MVQRLPLTSIGVKRSVSTFVLPIISIPRCRSAQMGLLVVCRRRRAGLFALLSKDYALVFTALPATEVNRYCAIYAALGRVFENSASL